MFYSLFKSDFGRNNSNSNPPPPITVPAPEAANASKAQSCVPKRFAPIKTVLDFVLIYRNYFKIPVGDYIATAFILRLHTYKL